MRDERGIDQPKNLPHHLVNWAPFHDAGDLQEKSVSSRGPTWASRATIEIPPPFDLSDAVLRPDECIDCCFHDGAIDNLRELSYGSIS